MILKRLVRLALLVLLCVIVAGGTLGARPSPTLRCEAAKLRAAGKKASRQLVCYSKAYRNKRVPSTVPDPRCIQATMSKFMRAFARAERKGPCLGNEATIEDAVDVCVVRIAAEVPQPGKCEALKLKAAATKAARRLDCFARQITDTRGSFYLGGCLAATSTRFGTFFDKAERRSACSGRKTNLADAIDSCIDPLQNLSPTTTTTSRAPTTTTTASSTTTTTEAPTTTTSSTTTTTQAPTTTTTSSTSSTTAPTTTTSSTTTTTAAPTTTTSSTTTTTAAPTTTTSSTTTTTAAPTTTTSSTTTTTAAPTTTTSSTTTTTQAPTTTTTSSTTTTTLAGEAPVPLGSAANFAVLAGSTVTNAGPTVVTGDLGVSPGTAVTGFPPGTVDGMTLEGDAIAAQAQMDLTTAFNDAAGRSVGVVPVAGNLGGQTLTPGVYKSTTSLAISSGDLTLDAQGNANAVFIFQMGTTLTTTANRQVMLIGMAKASNVFWQVGTSATLGTDSTFRGNILADQSITLNLGAALDGRALARAAAVTLNQNTVVTPAP